jgi:hypothetical protein
VQRNARGTAKAKGVASASNGRVSRRRSAGRRTASAPRRPNRTHTRAQGSVIRRTAASLQQPPKHVLHELLTLIVLNAFPTGHVERHHAVAHDDDLPAVRDFLECAEGIGIRAVVEGKRCAACDRSLSAISFFR